MSKRGWDFPPIPGPKKEEPKKEQLKKEVKVKAKTSDLESLAEEYGMDTAAVRDIVRKAVGLAFEGEGE